MTFALAILIGYLLGSVPFGVVLTRMAGKGDIRQVGSGNIGATNVLRTGSKSLALAVLLLDGAKGAVAVIVINTWAEPEPALMAMAGIAAMAGHLFPIWLRLGGPDMVRAIAILLAYFASVALGNYLNHLRYVLEVTDEVLLCSYVWISVCD